MGSLALDLLFEKPIMMMMMSPVSLSNQADGKNKLVIKVQKRW